MDPMGSKPLVHLLNTVDGRHPVPPGMYKNFVNDRINHLSTGAGFLPSAVLPFKPLVHLLNMIPYSGHIININSIPLMAGQPNPPNVIPPQK